MPAFAGQVRTNGHYCPCAANTLEAFHLGDNRRIPRLHYGGSFQCSPWSNRWMWLTAGRSFLRFTSPQTALNRHVEALPHNTPNP